MSIVLPNGTDVLSADNHARLHRCVASDSAAPDQSITVDASGRVLLLASLVFPDQSVQSTAASGTVTSVGATAPLASSGGTAPVISFTGTLSTGLGGTGTISNANTANGIVKLNGSAQLPAVDGSLLTGVNPLKTGMILMWSGTIASIPSGWAFCDGSNGTPDLRNMCIVGASVDVSGVAKTTVSGSATQTGGEATHTLVLSETPSHTHTTTFTGNLVSGNNLDALFPGGGPHGPFVFTTSSQGGNGAHNNLQPYYALAFIMKT